MALDLAAARAVAQARLLERAVHDVGPWEVEVGGIRVPAIRAITPSRVVFLAYFADQLTDDVAWLYCRGQLLSSQEIDVPPEPSCSVYWEISPTADTVGV
jgi:hypothetical protein